MIYSAWPIGCSPELIGIVSRRRRITSIKRCYFCCFVHLSRKTWKKLKKNKNIFPRFQNEREKKKKNRETNCDEFCDFGVWMRKYQRMTHGRSVIMIALNGMQDLSHWPGGDPERNLHWKFGISLFTQFSAALHRTASQRRLRKYRTGISGILQQFYRFIWIDLAADQFDVQGITIGGRLNDWHWPMAVFEWF